MAEVRIAVVHVGHVGLPLLVLATSGVRFSDRATYYGLVQSKCQLVMCYAAAIMAMAYALASVYAQSWISLYTYTHPTMG